MPLETIQLVTVTRVFGDGVELAEALGFPEISALDATASQWRACLQAKARTILEDATLAPAFSLHRRKVAATVEQDALELKIDPPRRAPDWEQPWTLRMFYVHWQENDCHHAMVPGTDIHVFASRAALLAERLEIHIRLLLAGRGRQLTLSRLAEVSRVTELRLGQLEVTAHRKTAKESAAARETTEEKKSVLDTLAEQLPPTVTPAGEAAKSAAPDSAAATSAAFELELELTQLAESLAGPHRRSVLIVGPSGCGKTALVRELARRRREFGFGHTAFWSTNGARLMTGPIGFGMWQERCQEMCREAAKSQAILHLGNLGELLEVGKTSRGEQSVGGFLQPWIARGEVLAIAECTPEQVSVIERTEPHLLGAFQQFALNERTPEQTLAILRQVLATAPGKFCEPSDGGATEHTGGPTLLPLPRGGGEGRGEGETVESAEHRTFDIQHPTSKTPLTLALSPSEGARGTAARATRQSECPAGNAATSALARLHQLHQRYATYSANPGRPLRFLRNLLADRFPEKQLTEALVISAFSRETGLPTVLLDDDVPLELQTTSDWFAKRVIGQPEAVERVVDLLVMIKARLARPRKPLASFLFIGPTGTGKTEMAKTMAGFLFGDPTRLVRFDLNEFSDPVSVQRLIGGSVVGRAEGLLTARIREQPFSVVLLNEFEKADPSFFDLLLQILGDGRLTDATGRVADFCNSVIVMTSNLGAEGFQRGPTGFRPEAAAAPEAQAHFADAVRQFLRPEIYNRLDAIVPFRALTPDIVLAIARRHLDALRQRDGIRLRAVEWQLQPEVADHLAARGYSARYGARPLKRVIERELLVPLAEALNQYQNSTALNVSIGVAGGKIQIQVRAHTNPQDRMQLQATSDLAGGIVAQRRRISRLEHCLAVTKIEDEVTMLEALERRLKVAQRKNPAVQTQLAKLPKLRECLRAVNQLSERAQHLETEALGLLYQREPVESALFLPELDALGGELRKLMREVFRQQLDRPDDVVLAFYSEHRETLLEFALAYYEAGMELGKVVALDYFLPPPGGRSKATKLLRETPKKPETFFDSPPEKLIGIVMHLRGDFFAPRFQPEAGLHVIKEKQVDRICLIETAALPFTEYEPPAGIDRQGAIESQGAPVRRTYKPEECIVRDDFLGERPWQWKSVRVCATQLTEERLNRAIEEATR